MIYFPYNWLSYQGHFNFESIYDILTRSLTFMSGPFQFRVKLYTSRMMYFHAWDQLNLGSIHDILPIWLTFILGSIQFRITLWYTSHISDFYAVVNSNHGRFMIYSPYYRLSCLGQFNWGSIYTVFRIGFIFMSGTIQFGVNLWYDAYTIDIHA